MDSVKDKVNDALKNPIIYTFSVIFRLGMVVMFLFFFLVALAIMGDGFKAVGGKESGSLFTSINNPIAGLMVGILATVLVQSSSTTTSVVVSATAAGVLGVQQGVPIIMGANIGTSVTNTIVSLGFVNDHENYERAFSGATVHDMFNFLGVVIFLPLDIIVNSMNGENGGIFKSIAEQIVPEDISSSENEDFFIKKEVGLLSKRIIEVNKDIISDYATGEPQTYCDRFGAQAYVMKDKKGCADSIIPLLSFSNTIAIDDPSYLLIGQSESGKFNCQCDSNHSAALFASGTVSGQVYDTFADTGGKCSGAFDWDFCVASKYDDAMMQMDFGINTSEYIERSTIHAETFYDFARTVKGGDLFESGYNDFEIGIISLIISLIVLIICLLGIVKIMQTILAGPAEKWVVAGLNYNFTGGGYLAILIGAGLTLLVQSSSITTSILTPMVAIGTLTLENMFPFTIGANLGTTVTGLIAGVSAGKKNGIQIALCHLFFNIFNTLVWYPIPFMREVPLNAARFLGTMAAAFRLFPVIYILVLFVTYPLFFLAVSVLLGGSGGDVAGGVILLLMFFGSHGFFLYWYHRMEGKVKVRAAVVKRADANKALKKEEAKAAMEDQKAVPIV